MKKEDAVRAGTILSQALIEGVKASGDLGLPVGHAYAMMMNHVTLESFNGLVVMLVKGKVLTNKNHLLQLHPEFKAKMETKK